MISLRGITKRYPMGDEEVVALDGVDLDIRAYGHTGTETGWYDKDKFNMTPNKWEHDRMVQLAEMVGVHPLLQGLCRRLLLDAGYLATRARLIDPSRAQHFGPGYGVKGGGTLRLQSGKAVVIGGQVAGSDGLLRAGERAQIDLLTSDTFQVLAGSTLLAAPALSLAQDKPTIRILLGLPPGGGTDSIAFAGNVVVTNPARLTGNGTLRARVRAAGGLYLQIVAGTYIGPVTISCTGAVAEVTPVACLRGRGGRQQRKSQDLQAAAAHLPAGRQGGASG